jgi:hypothetical protein
MCGGLSGAQHGEGCAARRRGRRASEGASQWISVCCRTFPGHKFRSGKAKPKRRQCASHALAICNNDSFSCVAYSGDMAQLLARQPDETLFGYFRRSQNWASFLERSQRTRRMPLCRQEGHVSLFLSCAMLTGTARREEGRGHFIEDPPRFAQASPSKYQ